MELSIKGMKWNIHKIEDDDEVWYRGKDIARMLGYKDTNKSLADHVNKEDRRPFRDFDNLKESMKEHPQTVFINKSGATSLISRCKLPNSIEIAKSLGIQMINKLTTKEADVMAQLIKIFRNANINYSFQYVCRHKEQLYKIDCYLPDYQIAIEVDEDGHKKRNVDYEQTREKVLVKQLDCIFIRVNPDAKDFCIWSFIGKIFDEIQKKLKQ